MKAEEAKNIVRSYPNAPQGGAKEVVGAITDQREARKFLEWLCGPEGQAIHKQLRAQKK